MNCRDARSSFSVLNDGRITSLEVASARDHIHSCPACTAEFERYTRLFGAMASLDPVAPARAFRRPPEPPGWAPSAEATSKWYVRSRRPLAAAAVILLMGSHFAVFRLSGEQQTPRSGSRAIESSVAPSLESLVTASPLQALRDHVDATDLFVRKIDQLPLDAGDEGVRLASANLRQLDSTNFPELQDASGFGDDSPAVSSYLQRFEAFRTDALRNLSSRSPEQAVRYLRLQIDRYELVGRMGLLQSLVAGEAQGCTWRDRRHVMPCEEDLPESVRRFLDEEQEMLQARFDQAAKGFARFRSDHPRSHLADLAVLMEMEANRRLNRWDRVVQLYGSHAGGMTVNPGLPTDPVGQMFNLIIQAVPGAVQADVGPWGGPRFVRSPELRIVISPMPRPVR